MEFARRWLCLDASREKEADRIERSPAAVGDETRVVVMAWQPEAGTGWPGRRFMLTDPTSHTRTITFSRVSTGQKPD